MQAEKKHLLTQLVCEYVNEHSILRDENSDLSNVNFHCKFGLSVIPPESWPYLAAIKSAIDSRPAAISDSRRVAIIYDSTDDYTEVHNEIGDCATYLSWHQIYTAMQIANRDTIFIKKIRTTLSEANLVFFVKSPATIPEVIDQVRCLCSGCLVMLG